MYDDYLHLSEVEFIRRYPHVGFLHYDELGRQILRDRELTERLRRTPPQPSDRLPVQKVRTPVASRQPTPEQQMWDLAATDPIAAAAVITADSVFNKILGLDIDPTILAAGAAVIALGAEGAGSFAPGAAAVPEVVGPPSLPVTDPVDKLRARGVDIDDPWTRSYIQRIYRDNRNPAASLRDARAQTGELKILIRMAAEPDVRRARFLRPTTGAGDRTPDIELEFTDGRRGYVEVRSVTAAPTGATVSEATTKPRSTFVSNPLFVRSVEDKIRHGQLSPAQPGRLMIYAPFETVTQTSASGWQDLLDAIISRGPIPAGITQIQVHGGGDMKTQLVFDAPSWRGRLVQE
jgi:hypothetical protein